ncbi:MAG: hypothetical protein IJQ88_10015 [Clostridia bacterium]|nr:hypothetical protein [Clostridia bacterium]
MAEFTPINTQEELNNIIGERLKRERETVTKELQEQITAKNGEISKAKTDLEALNKKLEEANQKISGIPALEEKIKGYEKASVKSKVAREIGIPYELAERLNGETEEDIRKDAESMKKLIGANTPTAPLKNTESGSGVGGDIIKQKWAEVAQNLKGE